MLDRENTHNNTHKHSNNEKDESNVKGLNPFSLLFIIVIVASLLTYVLPAGEFERTEQDGRTVVVPGSFEFIESSPIHPFHIFTSFHDGLMAGAAIIFIVFLFGGAIGIMHKTGAIESLVKKMAAVFKNKGIYLIAVLILLFGFLGTFIGMAEEVLIYIPIIVPIMIALRYDAITGVAIIFLGTLGVGFTSAITNPYTVSVAQGIAELPIGSGKELRVIMFGVFYIVTVIYVVRYAQKVKKNPSLAEYGKFSNVDVKNIDWNYKMPLSHVFALIVFMGAIGTLIYGVIEYEWYVAEISATIIIAAVLMGIICRLHPNEMGEGFVEGLENIAMGAIIIGFALAIVTVLENGMVLDVMLYYASNILNTLPTEIAAAGMFITQLFINLVVPSGSGQAALTMPIMAPLSDLLDITRQTAVLAFQLGDGLSNIIIPTSSILLGSLAIAGIPYTTWLKWVFPYFLIQVALGIVFIVIAQFIQLGPF